MPATDSAACRLRASFCPPRPPSPAPACRPRSPPCLAASASLHRAPLRCGPCPAPAGYADCWLPTAPPGRLLAADCSTRSTAGCRLPGRPCRLLAANCSTRPAAGCRLPPDAPADCWLPTTPPSRLLAADFPAAPADCWLPTAPPGRLLAADCSNQLAARSQLQPDATPT
nr:unconventional myosin-XVI-like [Aegilops tauschii subsp. strangulata]